MMCKMSSLSFIIIILIMITTIIMIPTRSQTKPLLKIMEGDYFQEFTELEKKGGKVRLSVIFFQKMRKSF